MSNNWDHGGKSDNDGIIIDITPIVEKNKRGRQAKEGVREELNYRERRRQLEEERQKARDVYIDSMLILLLCGQLLLVLVIFYILNKI